MNALSSHLHHVAVHPVHVDIVPETRPRDRLTTFFRPLLALPHLILVGAPVAFTITWAWGSSPDRTSDSGLGAGILGFAACLATLVAWVMIVLTGEHSPSLRRFSVWYMRWRVRANAYMALLRDDYPPFGDEPYPATFTIGDVPAVRDRWSVALRPFLAIPHLLMMWALGVAWFFATVGAWFFLLVTGRHPEELYRFGVAVLRFNSQVEAYLLLLHDELPPFALDAS
ncbi:MAG TPA: DUF4389 domain-containing protein [Gemmatimonadaceae bacterium]|nr:DUF4389 domain-containing protein [Gemmatimonadaceae bacterium]